MGGLDIIYKNSVEQHEIDNMGHMNVQFYVQHALDACEIFLKKKNLVQWPEVLNTRLTLEKILIRFLREQTLATPFSISANLVNVSLEKIQVLLEMQNLMTNGISASFLMTLKWNSIDRETKQILNTMGKNLSQKHPIPIHASKKGLLKLVPLDLTVLEINKIPNTLESFCGLAGKNYLNNLLQVNAADYMGVVSKAVPHLLLKSGHSVKDTGIGGAALEYEFRFNKFVDGGSSVMLKSGLRKITEKTYTWTHWLIELKNHEVIAVADSVIITMDLGLRKSVSIPRMMRSKLEELLIDKFDNTAWR